MRISLVGQRRGRRALASSAAIVAVTAGLAVAPLWSNAASATDYSQVSADSFYVPPAGFEKTAPGTILRSRPTTISFAGVVPQRAQAWQVLYRTSDQLGQPEATVTTVLEPAGATPDARRPLVGYQIATDSADPDCAPSHALQPGFNNLNVVARAELLVIDALLVKGYAVSVADYEGPDAAFAATKQAGYAVLDGLRAASNFAPLGLAGPTKTPMGLWGYSGGSIATNGAAEAESTYAPELHILGIATGGSAGDLNTALSNNDGSFGSGFVLSAIAGLTAADPTLQTYLNSVVTPAGAQALAKVRTMCVLSSVVSYPFKTVQSYSTVPNILQQPIVKNFIASDNFGQHTPTAPMYMYQGVFDELLPIASVDQLVQARCAQGATIEYRRDLLAEHGIAVLTGAAGSLYWLEQRLAGVPPKPGCSTTTVLTNLTAPGTAQVFGSQLIYGNLLALLGVALGPTGPYRAY